MGERDTGCPRDPANKGEEPWDLGLTMAGTETIPVKDHVCVMPRWILDLGCNGTSRDLGNRFYIGRVILDAVLHHITSPMHPWGSETPVALEIRLTKAKLW